MPSLPPCSAVAAARLRLIAGSYRRLTGKPLLGALPQEESALRDALWQAPFAIVAHGAEADPVFFYGNRYALQCFEMDFPGFAKLPSRLSAEPLAQEARDRLLQQVARQGYVEGYSGVRIASGGRRFMIADCTVWNLGDAQGVCHGQAAVFVRA